MVVLLLLVLAFLQWFLPSMAELYLIYLSFQVDLSRSAASVSLPGGGLVHQPVAGEVLSHAGVFHKEHGGEHVHLAAIGTADALHQEGGWEPVHHPVA